MPAIDIVIETPISTSVRAAQVSSMFDVPAAEKCRLEWHGELPIDEKPWNVGLIVGPSGCGKSTILNNLFGEPQIYEWNAASVIDDIERQHSIEAIARICQSVGFNTIPAWLRPYSVLSNGEKFRVDLARRLLGEADPIVCDEFTSVVDRQVAKIGAHAVQKNVRRDKRRFVAASCHYDLEDWLQPDWVLEPATMVFRWRAVQRRPLVNCTICRAPYDSWRAFSKFHYLTADLHRSARCYVLSVEDEPAALCAVLYRPHPKVADIFGMSRLVTLPDFQGLGLAFALADRVAGAYKAAGKRYHSYPAHPSLIRSFDRSPMWRLERSPGMVGKSHTKHEAIGKFGGRPCAVFSYVGPAMEDRDLARGLTGQ